MDGVIRYKLRAWIPHYKLWAYVERINFDVETVEVQIGEGDLYEFNFSEVEILGEPSDNGVPIDFTCPPIGKSKDKVRLLSWLLST